MKLVGHKYNDGKHCVACSESELGKDDLGYMFSFHVPSETLITPIYDEDFVWDSCEMTIEKQGKYYYKIAYESTLPEVIEERL